MAQLHDTYDDDDNDDGWRDHPKHVEQFTEKINCVLLLLVGHLLTYIYLPEDVFTIFTILTPTNAQVYENQFMHTVELYIRPTVWPLSGILITAIVEIKILRMYCYVSASNTGL